MTQLNNLEVLANQVQILVPTTLPLNDELAGLKNTSKNHFTQVLACMKRSPLTPFNAPTLTFLQDFSKALLAEKEPELKALGFWLRKSQVSQWQTQYESDKEKDAQHHIFNFPIGSVLHFTPANVDTMFVYSWVCALVLGNISVLRLSRQESLVKQRLLSVIDALFQNPQYHEIAARNLFISYDHQASITSALSRLSDARILWGGDEAVNQIRSIPAKPKTRDIGFADRYSVAIVDAEKLVSEDDITDLTEKLWRDVLPYQQQACSSPKVIFWLGSATQKQRVAKALNQLAEKQQLPEQTRMNEWLVATQLVKSQSKETNVLLSEHVCLLELAHFDSRVLQWHCGSGLLYIVSAASLEGVLENLDERCQTLSYWGMDKALWVKLIQQSPITNLDRIVPVGQSLDFSSTWDGFDLIEQLQRKITIL